MPVGARFIPARIGENKKMTEHKKLQPEIRFAGFTDDWEQRKLGEVVERITRKNLNLESRLPLTISAQDGLISQTEFFDKQVASKNISGYYLIENGEFAYNKSYSNGYPWGAIKRLDKYKNGVLSTLYIVFKPIDVDSQFLVSYFDTTFWHSEIAEIAVEGARNHGLLNIPVMDFFRIKIKIPKSKEEQTQIGNFFKQLDDTIALHQRTLEKYQKLKISYLEKMFPKENELYPELRFPNFTDAWEQRKLEEFSKTTIGEFVIKTKQNPNSKYPVYNGGVSYTGFYDDFNNNGHKIIVSARGANAGFINIINGKYWAGNSCYSIDIQDNYCIEYVYHFMKHKQHLFTDFQQAANIPSVSKKDVEEFLISYPKSKEEQTQIGNFFKQLDDTIALHQQEVEKYKKIKQSYLEKMFI